MSSRARRPRTRPPGDPLRRRISRRALLATGLAVGSAVVSPRLPVLAPRGVSLNPLPQGAPGAEVSPPSLPASAPAETSSLEAPAAPTALSAIAASETPSAPEPALALAPFENHAGWAYSCDHVIPYEEMLAE